MTIRLGPILVFAAVSLLTIVSGAIAMQLGGVPLGIWIRNPIAWAIAVVLSLVLVRGKTLWMWAAPVALVLIALSLLGPEQEGVHRWLGAGPVQLNAAALVLPAAIAAFTLNRAAFAIPSFAAIAAILAWQPDISQLAGFATAAIVLATSRFGWKGAAASIAIAAGAIALCLSRPDPLEPVAHVEGILALAWSQSATLTFTMAAGIALTALAPLLFWRDPSLRWPAAALSAYFAATALAPAFGAYPVPLAGYGLSFVIGWPLGFAALLALKNQPPQGHSLTPT